MPIDFEKDVQQAVKNRSVKLSEIQAQDKDLEIKSFEVKDKKIAWETTELAKILRWYYGKQHLRNLKWI